MKVYSKAEGAARVAASVGAVPASRLYCDLCKERRIFFPLALDNGDLSPIIAGLCRECAPTQEGELPPVEGFKAASLCVIERESALRDYLEIEAAWLNHAPTIEGDGPDDVFEAYAEYMQLNVLVEREEDAEIEAATPPEIELFDDGSTPASLGALDAQIAAYTRATYNPYCDILDNSHFALGESARAKIEGFAANYRNN